MYRVQSGRTGSRCQDVLHSWIEYPLHHNTCKTDRSLVGPGCMKQWLHLGGDDSHFFLQGHKRAKECEAAVRRAALRAARDPPRRTVRDQQRAGVRDTRGRLASRLRPG